MISFDNLLKVEDFFLLCYVPINDKMLTYL